MRFKSIIYILLAFSIASIALPSTSNAQWVKAVVAITGNITDDISKNAVSASVVVYDNTGKKVNSGKSNSKDGGYYYITGLIPGNIYNFEIVAENYLKEWISMSIPNSDKYLELSRDFNLKPGSINSEIPLSVSPFEFNKSKLRFGSSVSLEKLAITMKNNPEVKFTILSYPDNNTNQQYNKDLTKKRANALYDYFVVNGIDPTRMKIKESTSIDPKSPLPSEKRAKGKKYIGPTYIVIN